MDQFLAAGAFLLRTQGPMMKVLPRICAQHRMSDVLGRLLDVPLDRVLDDTLNPLLPSWPDINDDHHRRRWPAFQTSLLVEYLMSLSPDVNLRNVPPNLHGKVKSHMMCHGANIMFQHRGDLAHAIRAVIMLVITKKLSYSLAWQFLETFCVPNIGDSARPLVGIISMDGVRLDIARELIAYSRMLSALLANNTLEPWTVMIDAETILIVFEFVNHRRYDPAAIEPRRAKGKSTLPQEWYINYIYERLVDPVATVAKPAADEYSYFRTQCVDGETPDGYTYYRTREEKNRKLHLVVTAAMGFGFTELHEFCVNVQKWLAQYEKQKVERATIEAGAKDAEMARRRLELEVAAEAKQRSKKDALKALKQSLADVKTEEAKGRREVEGEHTKQTAALREERTKDAARVARLVKTAQQKIEAKLEKKEEEEEKAAEPSKKPKKKKKPKHVDVVESPPPPPVVASATARFDPFEAPPRRTADMSLLTSVIGPPAKPIMEPLGAFKTWGPF